MPKLRLFFAIDTPALIRTKIAAISHALQESHAEVKWEPITKLHCTVKFLGDTDESLLQDLVKAARTAVETASPSLIRYRMIGCFPATNDPRVVWVGMEDLSGMLSTVHDRLDAALATLGFQREERSFHPHVTLGRVKGRRNLGHLITLLESLTFDTEPTTISELHLVKSDLLQSGSVYTTLQKFPFGKQ
jgi:2'-5' RNA ligase